MRLEEFDSCVEGELSESDLATEFVEEGASDDPDGEKTFTDAKGQRYYPLFLMACSNDATCYAGLAVLALSESPKAIDAELLIALGTHLMQMGDARGLRV